VRCAIKPDNDKSNNNKNILNSHTLTKHYRMSYVLGGLYNLQKKQRIDGTTGVKMKRKEKA